MKLVLTILTALFFISSVDACVTVHPNGTYTVDKSGCVKARPNFEDVWDFIEEENYTVAKWELVESFWSHPISDQTDANVCEDMLPFVFMRYFIAVKEGCLEDIESCAGQLRMLIEQIAIQKRYR